MKRHCPNLHPLLVREFAHRVVVNGYSLDRFHCSASDPDEFLRGKTNNRLYEITIANFLFRAVKPTK